MRVAVRLLGLSFGFACLWQSPLAEPGQRPPNFILILADDLGYGDVGFYSDQPIATPNLDRMAAEGVQLTSFYAAPVCTPARAALLTGRYPIRFGLQRVLSPGSRQGIPASELTLPELLQRRGYETALIGKWHLGDRPQFRPSQHGFAEYFGLLYSNDMTFLRPQFRRLKLYRDDQAIESPVKQDTLTRRYTEESIRFIERNRDRPFFLYLAHSMPHVPQHASADFRGRSKRGIYGDAVEEIDWSVGRILDTLKALGLDQSTLVMFTSDNGPAVGKRLHGGSPGPLRGGKNTTWEGGVRVPAIVRWPDRIPPGSRTDGIAGLIDLLPTFATLAGQEIPPGVVLDGRDMMPLLTGGLPPHDEYFYLIKQEIFAVRSGPWKLHFKKTETGPEGRQDAKLCRSPELYDLNADPAESHDISAQHPDQVERLTQLAEAFAKSVPGVLLPK